MKLKKILIIIAVLVILLFPIKRTYKDGGTKEYSAILYKVIKWHTIDENYESGFYESTDFHIFPTNFHTLDYYRKIMPYDFYILNSDKTEKIRAQIGSYSWCKVDVDNNTTRTCETALAVDPTDIKYKDSLTIKKDEKIYHENNMDVTKIEVYKDKQIYKELGYIKREKSIRLNLDEGEYIVVIHAKYVEGTVWYSFKVNIE